MTRWLQVTVSGSESGFLWLVPAAPGARIDLASDAWLDALDDATAPTILAPASQAPPDAGASVQQISRGPLPPSTSPVGSGVAVDPATLGALVAAGGGTLSSSQAATFGAVFQAGLDVVVLDYDAPAGAATTHSVQIVEGAIRSLDVPMSGGDALYTDATTFVIASARANVGPTSLTLDPATITWEGGGTSTYASAEEQALEAGLGEAWLTNSAMPDRFFDPLQLLGAPALPAVLARYFELASARGDTSQSPGACEAAAALLRSSTGSVAALCPPGQLAVVPGPSPCLVAPAYAVPADALGCGSGVTDAAFALAELSPSSVWLTRTSGLLLASQSDNPAVSLAPGPPVSTVVTASAGSAPGSGSGGTEAPAAAASSAPSSAPSAPSASPSGAVPSSTPETDSQGTTAVAEEAASAASDGCDSSPSEPSDSSDSSGCDSSTSSSDDSSGDGCSGSTDDSNDDCSVQRPGHHPTRQTVKLLFLALTAVTVARRAVRPRIARDDAKRG